MAQKIRFRYNYKAVLTYLALFAGMLLLNFTMQIFEPFSLALFAAALACGFNPLACAGLYILAGGLSFAAGGIPFAVFAVQGALLGGIFLFYERTRRAMKAELALYLFLAAALFFWLFGAFVYRDYLRAAIVAAVIFIFCFVFIGAMRCILVRAGKMRLSPEDFVFCAAAVAALGVGLYNCAGSYVYESVALLGILLACGLLRNGNAAFCALVLSLPPAICGSVAAAAPQLVVCAEYVLYAALALAFLRAGKLPGVLPDHARAAHPLPAVCAPARKTAQQVRGADAQIRRAAIDAREHQPQPRDGGGKAVRGFRRLPRNRGDLFRTRRRHGKRRGAAALYTGGDGARGVRGVRAPERVRADRAGGGIAETRGHRLRQGKGKPHRLTLRPRFRLPEPLGPALFPQQTARRIQAARRGRGERRRGAQTPRRPGARGGGDAKTPRPVAERARRKAPRCGAGAARRTRRGGHRVRGGIHRRGIARHLHHRGGEYFRRRHAHRRRARARHSPHSRLEKRPRRR